MLNNVFKFPIHVYIAFSDVISDQVILDHTSKEQLVDHLGNFQGVEIDLHGNSLNVYLPGLLCCPLVLLS